MELSTRQIASVYLDVRSPFRFREALFEPAGNPSLRDKLETIRSRNSGFALPPKLIPEHPRLAPLPAIHFDHYNSSVTNLHAPGIEDRLDVDLHKERLATILGTCLNFMVDSKGGIYGFCGNLSEGFGDSQKGLINVQFKLVLFNNRVEKIDEFKILEFTKKKIAGDDLPINLGYFVMDNEDRVIVVKNRTDIVFVKKDRSNKLRAVQIWPMRDKLRRVLPREVADHGLAQVMPAYDRGYWAMALGDQENKKSAFVAMISNSGDVMSHYEFKNEVIENGMAVDSSGAYIVTDYAMYKFISDHSGKISMAWRKSYDRSSYEKKEGGVLSKFGSGSTPTLFGSKEDLVAITDNADRRVNLLVYHRRSGRQLFKIPVFQKDKSANENTVLAYRDSIVVQNWYGSPDYDEDMKDLVPGLVRFDIRSDRLGYNQKWWNEKFASTATVRLSTRTGLIYGTIQEDAILEKYAMAFIDFESGRKVREVHLGRGRGHRIAMSPAYLIPGGWLIQPVRRGMVTIKKK